MFRAWVEVAMVYGFWIEGLYLLTGSLVTFALPALRGVVSTQAKVLAPYAEK